MVFPMSEQQYQDPSGNTEQFRAFVQSSPEPAQGRALPVGLIVGVGVAVVILIVLVVWLALS
jgi:hypothetical protein